MRILNKAWFSILPIPIFAFKTSLIQTKLNRRALASVVFASNDDTEDAIDKKTEVEEYRNAVTQVLSNFMQKNSISSKKDPISEIDFEAPKISPSTSLETLVSALDYDLLNSEWFVTGKVNPCYFSPKFKFQDPDAKLEGIEEYARGVNKLFDQSTSRAEILSTVLNTTAS